jgi:hypothetical protein
MEKRLYKLMQAGLIEIHERRNRRGDFEPYEWQLTAAGRAVIRKADNPNQLDKEIEAFIQDTQTFSRHPVLRAIREWLVGHKSDNDTASRILMAIGKEIASGRIPTERTVSLSGFGSTKVVRIASYPEAVTDALGFLPEKIVRRAGQAVYVYGPFSFSIRGRRIDGQWSLPWLALTRDTVSEMTALSITGEQLLTIENLTAFEEAVREGLPPGTIALYTGGFPGALEMAVLKQFIDAGIRSINHWGDMDLGGLRIFRYLKETLNAPVAPYRMTLELLSTLPTVPLTESDRSGLNAWLNDNDAPLKELADAMIKQNRKAEQEGWFLHNCSVDSIDS